MFVVSCPQSRFRVRVSDPTSLPLGLSTPPRRRRLHWATRASNQNAHYQCLPLQGLFERAQKAFDLKPDSFDLTYTDDIHANRSARLTNFSDFTALVCDQVDQQMSLGHLQRDIKGRIVVVFNIVPKQDVQTSLPGPELFIDQAEDDMGTTMPGGFSLAPVDPVTVQMVHDEEEEDDNKPLSLLKREQPTLMRQSKRDDASEFPAAEPVTCQAGPPPPPTVSLSQIQSHIHPIRGPVHRHIHQPRASSPCHPDHGQLQDADVIEGTEGAAGTEDPRMIQMKRSLDARRKVQEALQQQSRSKPLSPTAVPSAPSPVSPMADGYHPKYTTSVPDSTALSEPHASSSMHGNAPQRPPAAETWPGVKGLTRFVDDFNRFLSDNFGDEGAFELRLDKRPSDNDADVKHQPASSPEEAISEENQAEASYVHRNVFCDFCLKTIVGRRWKCAGCSNFDSCNSCYTTKVPAHHSSNHPFILITRSQAKSSLINANSKLPVPAVRSFRPRHSATCDICDKSVFGTRYKCLSCKDWDVCEECINQVTDKHDASHEYAKMELPGSVATLYTPPAHSARDVTLADEAHSAFCDCCAETIVGPRYKCNTCPDFDLCSLCILKSTTAHPETLHNFKRIARPGATPTLFYPPRQISQWSVKAGYLATCDVCSQAIGDDSSKYKCLSCTDWDAGDCCWAQLGEQGQSPHPSSHTFGRIDRPGAAMVMCRPPLGDNGENTAEAKARKGEDDEEKVATDLKTVQASHPARCDSCQQTIIGVRYKCEWASLGQAGLLFLDLGADSFWRNPGLACPDYDLDETCFAQAEATHPSHDFVAIEDPLSIIYSSAHTESNLAPATHRFIVCDGCGTSPIVGTRYHCAHALCPDLDLCDKCEADPIPLPPSVKHEHDKRTHPMIKIPRPMGRFGVGEKDVTNAVLKARRGMSQHEEISRSSSNSSSTEDKATAQSNEFSLEAVVNGALQALGAGAAEANASSSVSLPEWATLSRPVHRQLDAQSGSGDDTTVMIDVDVGRMLAAQMGGLTVDIEREAKIEITSGDDKAKTQGQAQSQKLDESVEVQDAVASGVSLDESPRATFVADVSYVCLSAVCARRSHLNLCSLLALR